MIAGALLLVALALLWLALRLRRSTGVPWARVRLSDTGWQAVDQPLRSQRYGLIGKPDYVIETRRGLVPIEVKPSRRAATPYASDLMQLAAYCLLLEETEGAPPYGLLRYAEHTFKLPYSEQIRADLLELLHDMRADRDAADVARSHAEPGRCRGCGFWEQCEDRLSG